MKTAILFLLLWDMAFGQRVTDRDEECIKRYAYLETLSLEYFDLHVVVKARKLQVRFFEKLTDAYFPTVSDGDDRLQWLKKNWKKTKFKSFVEGKRDYDAMIAAENAVSADRRIIKIRADFDETYKLCGSAYYTDFVTRLKKKYPGKFYPAN